MVLAYQLAYNDRVVANGAAFNEEVDDYLDKEFKDHVTATIEECLRQRPSDPVRFLAEHISKHKATTTEAQNAATAAPSAASGDEHGAPTESMNGNAAKSISISQMEADEGSRKAAAKSPSTMHLYFAGGVCCEVQAASQTYASAEGLPGVAVLCMQSPSVYEMATALSHLEAAATPNTATGEPTPTLVIVEPPAAPSEAVFLKGIPYIVTLVEQLQYHKRRDNGDAPAPVAGETFTAKAFALLQEKLGDTLQDLTSAMASVVLEDEDSSDGGSGLTVHPQPSQGSAATPVDISAAKEECPPRRRLVVLPAVQDNYMSVFDHIDTGFREAMHPEFVRAQQHHHYSDAPNPLASPYVEPPCVLFVSFNKQTAALTYSRVLAALLPYHDRTQRTKLSAIRDRHTARWRELSVSHCVEYWTSVHRRREERDEARGVRRGPLRRCRNGHSTNGLLAAPGAKTTDSSSVSALQHPQRSVILQAPAPGTPMSTSAVTHRSVDTSQDPLRAELKSQAASEREQRRQCEDSAFLEVVSLLRVQAATRLQAVARGCRTRRLRKEKGDGQREQSPGGRGSTNRSTMWDDPLPEAVPALLRLSMKHLAQVHGEVFGNYTQSLPAAPRRATVYRPVRRTLPATFDEDGDSETEEWVTEELLVPQSRTTTTSPHFNPLRRLLECLQFSTCDILDDAMRLQRQCGGMSFLQLRAYDMLKSVVLSLHHIAFTELYHRRLLSSEHLTFSGFMRGFHTEVLGWLSQPHLVSLAALHGDMHHDSAAEPEDSAGRQHAAATFDEQALHYDRILVEGQTNVGIVDRCDEQFDDASLVTRVAPGVFVAPPVPTLTQLARLLEHVRADAQAQDAVVMPLSTGKSNSGSNGDHTDATVRVGCTHVHWWALCPHPVAYVCGLPFVLAPRSNGQSVEGRSGYDEFVIRRIHQAPAHKECFNTTQPPPPQRTPGAEPDRDVGATSTSSLPQKSKIQDREDLTGAQFCPMTGDCSVGPEAPSSCPAVLAAFAGASLAREDGHLAGMLRSEQQRLGESVQYFRVPCAAEGSAEEAAGTPYYTALAAKQLVRGQSADLSVCAGVADVPEAQRASSMVMSITSNEVTSRTHSMVTVGLGNGHGDYTSGMEKPLPSGGQVPMPSCMTASTTSTRVPAKGGHAATAGYLAGVQTLQAAAAKAAGLAAGVTLTVARPFLVPTSLDTWAHRFHEFLEATVAQLQAGASLILSCEEPTQSIYVVATAMVAGAIEQAGLSTAAATAKSNVNMAMAQPPDSPNRAVSSAVRRVQSLMALRGPGGGSGTRRQSTSGDGSAVEFLNEFYAPLRVLGKSNGISIEECVASVQTLVEGVSPVNFLSEIADGINEAETEPNMTKCQRIILRVIQLTEHYCWLVLLQLFLALPFTRDALMRTSRSSLPSFHSFARSLPAAAWMESIDPWRLCPEKCPDVCHLRYSNWLRRWDNRDYICFGAW